MVHAPCSEQGGTRIQVQLHLLKDKLLLGQIHRNRQAKRQARRKTTLRPQPACRGPFPLDPQFVPALHLGLDLRRQTNAGAPRDLKIGQLGHGQLQARQQGRVLHSRNRTLERQFKPLQIGLHRPTHPFETQIDDLHVLQFHRQLRFIPTGILLGRLSTRFRALGQNLQVASALPIHLDDKLGTKKPQSADQQPTLQKVCQIVFNTDAVDFKRMVNETGRGA